MNGVVIHINSFSGVQIKNALVERCHNIMFLNESFFTKDIDYSLFKNYDFVIMDFCDFGGRIVTEDIADHINAICPIIIWCGDICPETPEFVLNFAKKYKLLISNKRDIKFIKENAPESINNVAYNNHFNESLCNFKKPPKAQFKDIIFIANKHSHYPLAEFRESIVKKLKDSYQDRFIIYGSGYGKCNQIPLSYAPYLYLYSKIAISINNVMADSYFSDRLLYSMASGCFVLCHRFENCETIFKDKKELVYFDEFKDLKKKIDYYLIHDDKRDKIAKAGKKRAIEQFGDDAFFNSIKSIL